MDLNLHNSEWDCCVVGNGVSAMWVAHALWSVGKSTIWVTSEEPYSPSRAMLQHGWFWDLSPEQAAQLRENVRGVDDAEGAGLPDFEAAFFDARSTRRFRKFSESKAEWGLHEKAFFERLAAVSGHVDLWRWHERLHAFHDSGQTQGPMQIELSAEPRFVRAQGWPLLELKTEAGKITSVVLSAMSKTEEIELRAAKFYLGDYDESFPQLVKNPDDSERLASALKGKAYRAGFGLRLWHKELGSVPEHTAVVPLVVSPEKDEGAHVAGRFTRTAGGLESLWIGFLTDDELEDNNEILKKIKQAKRAIERAVPGFGESILREAVTFEPRMCASDLVKNRKPQALGAALFSDHYGPASAADALAKILGGAEKTGERKPASQERAPAPEASL